MAEEHYQEINFPSFKKMFLKCMVNKKCWNIGRYLDSMLYLDFGGERSIKTRRGYIVTGTDTIGVRDCYWAIYHKGLMRLNSDLINDQNESTLKELIGKELLDIFKDNQAIQFIFNNDYQINIDITNKYHAEGDSVTDSILQLSSINGKEYEIEVFGNIYCKTM